MQIPELPLILSIFVLTQGFYTNGSEKTRQSFRYKYIHWHPRSIPSRIIVNIIVTIKSFLSNFPKKNSREKFSFLSLSSFPNILATFYQNIGILSQNYSNLKAGHVQATTVFLSYLVLSLYSI